MNSKNVFRNSMTFQCESLKWSECIFPAIYSALDLQSDMKYRQVSNISRTKSQHLKYSRTVLWLSLPNLWKPDVKSRMKM